MAATVRRRRATTETSRTVGAMSTPVVWADPLSGAAAAARLLSWLPLRPVLCETCGALGNQQWRPWRCRDCGGDGSHGPGVAVGEPHLLATTGHIPEMGADLTLHPGAVLGTLTPTALVPIERGQRVLRDDEDAIELILAEDYAADVCDPENATALLLWWRAGERDAVDLSDSLAWFPDPASLVGHQALLFDHLELDPSPHPRHSPGVAPQPAPHPRGAAGTITETRP